MKICQICVGYPPDFGGTVTHNYTLVEYLLKRGYDVDVIAMRHMKKETLDALHSNSDRLKNVHDIFPATPLLWFYQLKKEVKKIDKKSRINLFDIHKSPYTLPFVFDRRKKILSLHFFEMTCPLPKWPRPCKSSFSKCTNCISRKRYLYWKTIKSIAKRRADTIIVKYAYLKNLLIREGIRESKIKLVPHWVDIDKIRIGSQKKVEIKGICENDTVFTFFGRLNPEKGVDLLLKAFKIVTKNIKDVKLLIAGSGPRETELKKMTKELNIEKEVLFLGSVPHKKLFKKLYSTDCFVFPHRYFNYEWALLEAMATKKPIIATDVAATRDILAHGENAMLAKPEPKSISDSMKYFIDNKSKCNKMAKKAYATVKKRHNKDNLKKYEDIINLL